MEKIEGDNSRGSIVLATVAPTLCSLCTFAGLALSGGQLHASRVFASLALFNFPLKNIVQ